MAVAEKSVLLRHKDNTGNTNILYPVTTVEHVDGLEEALDGKANSSHTHDELSVKDNNYKQGTDLPSTYPRGETVFFSDNPTNRFNGIQYCTVHTIKGYTNMAAIQWVYPYNTNHDVIYYRTATFRTDAWRDWQTISVSGHTHKYAGSSSEGGSATSAVKLDSSDGSATQPVYFSGGKPVACTYTLGKSVPSNAKFTDTVNPAYIVDDTQPSSWPTGTIWFDTSATI